MFQLDEPYVRYIKILDRLGAPHVLRNIVVLCSLLRPLLLYLGLGRMLPRRCIWKSFVLDPVRTKVEENEQPNLPLSRGTSSEGSSDDSTSLNNEMSSLLHLAERFFGLLKSRDGAETSSNKTIEHGLQAREIGLITFTYVFQIDLAIASDMKTMWSPHQMGGGGQT